MGNLRPELFGAVVAEVPFVDVVTTMSDESLPLTVTEWEEWGNPRDDPAAYAYMKSYSPYDNVQPRGLPSHVRHRGAQRPARRLLGAGQVGRQVARHHDREQAGGAAHGDGGWPPGPIRSLRRLEGRGQGAGFYHGRRRPGSLTRPRPVAWTEWAQGRAQKTRARDRWRQPRDFDARGPRGQLDDGRTVVSFASNDYLGLSSHPLVVAAAHEALDRWGAGAGASRLVSGSRPVHSDLERDIADWKQTEAACALPSGYAANFGLLSALAGPQVLICADELNHASIIDGCRLAQALGARVELYPHGDVNAVYRSVGFEHRPEAGRN